MAHGVGNNGGEGVWYGDLVMDAFERRYLLVERALIDVWLRNAATSQLRSSTQYSVLRPQASGTAPPAQNTPSVTFPFTWVSSAQQCRI
jgi:hypothetical protein